MITVEIEIEVVRDGGIVIMVAVLEVEVGRGIVRVMG